MSLDLGDSRADPATVGTAAATMTALFGFPLVFYAFTLLILCLSALGVALLGTASGGSPSDAVQAGGFAMALAIAVANFAVATIVIGAVFKLFAEARERPTVVAFAIGYAALCGLVALTTDIDLLWSVIGVASACLLRYLRPASD